MKNKIIALTLSLLASSQAFATANRPGEVCVDSEFITQLEFGYITNITGGPDHGSAVLVHLSDGTSIPLNFHMNANDRKGKAIIDALTLAFFSQRKVTLLDHWGHRCDDFDQLIIPSP
ncbi:hypothetical protein [Pseudoteredinibacter isoporae]|uniref:Uncharacterized protein n=1 Tax=Pseudoteredinibacter isoporae TaxID=570281 RepID=A0A7X0MX76_9GAMM|nr:hypothetical protein [Pseudoteredinibacter isoporae]MBB6523188.1 hypothetical protein [Pseudoteredinibacter isoporae]NHO88706.1 hypothetical protein [Pseudoteredinibacter isoporae]NIB22603.1 hypothetical protein [Pseudoteredinibacter isoporae]